MYNALKDYRELRKAFGVKQCATCSEEVEKTWAHIKSDDECEKKDRICAKGLAAIALMNGPNDIDDITSAWKEIKSGFKAKNPDGYDPKKHNIRFLSLEGLYFINI